MSHVVTHVRKEGLDKFYTNIDYAKSCITKVNAMFPLSEFDFIIDPSAGNGSFYYQLPFPNKIGIDIQPDTSDIIMHDFFDYSPPSDKHNILVITNPPFGKICSLAVKFFNHSASWASVIAFIIPRTFRKISVQNRLHPAFHLIYDEDVPVHPCCFIPPIQVKCCFQIWEKHNEMRLFVKLPSSHPDWNFLPYGHLDEKKQPTPPEHADFALRAYGGCIGEIRTIGLSNLRPKSWHWIKANINVKVLIERFKHLNYRTSQDTARQNSMGKKELIRLYTEYLDRKTKNEGKVCSS